MTTKIAYAPEKQVVRKSTLRHYFIIATVGLLLSLGLPISAGFGYGAPGTPPANTATVITLSLMHVVYYAISVPMFSRVGMMGK